MSGPVRPHMQLGDPRIDGLVDNPFAQAGA